MPPWPPSCLQPSRTRLHTSRPISGLSSGQPETLRVRHGPPTMRSAVAKQPTGARSSGGLLTTPSTARPLPAGRASSHAVSTAWQTLMRHTSVRVPQRRPRPSHRRPLMAGGPRHGPSTKLTRPRDRYLSQRSVGCIIQPGAATSGASTPTCVLVAACRTLPPTARSSVAVMDHPEPEHLGRQTWDDLAL